MSSSNGLTQFDNRSSSLCILKAFDYFLVCRTRDKMTDVFFMSILIVGIYRPSVHFSSAVLVRFDSFSVRARGFWWPHSMQFNFRVCFTDSVNPATADILWHPPQSPNWSLRLRYTPLVHINTLFPLERHFCYFLSFLPTSALNTSTQLVIPA